MNKLTFKNKSKDTSKPANKAFLPGGTLNFKKDALKAQKELTKTDIAKNKEKIQKEQFLLTKRAVEPRQYYIYQWHYQNRHEIKYDDETAMPVVENHFEPKKRLKPTEVNSDQNEKSYKPLGPDPKTYMTESQLKFFRLQQERCQEKKDEPYLQKMEKFYNKIDNLYQAFEMPVEKHY